MTVYFALLRELLIKTITAGLEPGKVRLKKIRVLSISILRGNIFRFRRLFKISETSFELEKMRRTKRMRLKAKQVRDTYFECLSNLFYGVDFDRRRVLSFEPLHMFVCDIGIFR